MSDDFRIDSHKLIYHPGRVAEWLNTGDVYPIYVEIAPSGTCNHRCIFCALDYMEYKPVFMDKDLILANLQEMAGKGVKSVMYAGEGEPLFNKDTPEIVNRTKGFGIDVAITTNGVLLTKEVAEHCLQSLSWIRLSINAGTEDTYKKVHKGKSGDFEKVLSNLRNAVEIKKRKKLKTTIGVQLLLIPENSDEVLLLGRRLKEIGVDYYSIKPFSQHPKSLCTIEPSFNYEKHLELEAHLNELKSDSMNIVFRSNAMRKLKYKRKYNRCLGNPFWAYIDATANVWACSAYLGDLDFCFGNLREKSFTEIWQGEQRKQALQRIAGMDVSGCRVICRLDEINTYLHQLKNPNEHVNFI